MLDPSSLIDRGVDLEKHRVSDLVRDTAISNNPSAEQSHHRPEEATSQCNSRHGRKSARDADLAGSGLSRPGHMMIGNCLRSAKHHG